MIQSDAKAVGECRMRRACSKSLASTGLPAKLSSLAAALYLFGISGCAMAETASLSGNLPLSVKSLKATPLKSRPSFDRFSWQSFIALNWPADPKIAGKPRYPNKPSVFRKPPAGATTVWESYKESFQLFGTGDRLPKPWSDPTVVGNPCKKSKARKTLYMVAKATDVLDDLNEAFSHPLIDQNKNYVYAEVRFNEPYYDFVRSNRYYLKKNLPAPSISPMQMPATTTKPPRIGAIMIKASWRFITKEDDTSRYHVITAQVLDPSSGDCKPQRVGLVGLHIAHKLKDFPEWIWSSFEQVDNVQRGPGATADTPISFNNGTAKPVTPKGWANRPPLAPPLLPMNKRVPVQVTRYNPIPTTPTGKSTVDINKQYQALLSGTPWAFYQLVITQWPTNASDFNLRENGGVYPKDSGQPFPVNGATNTAMETFLQSQTDAAGAGGNSCMQCHYGTGTTDFSWILQNKSH
jgi:hypothetical protein